MWPDRVSNPGPPTYESGALPIALRGPANHVRKQFKHKNKNAPEMTENGDGGRHFEKSDKRSWKVLKRHLSHYIPKWN